MLHVINALLEIILSNSGGTELDSCDLCKPGMACTVEGLTQPDEVCKAGHFCCEVK